MKQSFLLAIGSLVVALAVAAATYLWMTDESGIDAADAGDCLPPSDELVWVPGGSFTTSP